MESSTTTAREAQKSVLTYLLREHAAAKTSAAFQMGRGAGKRARSLLSQRFAVKGVERKTFSEDGSDLNISEQLKCRGTSVSRASPNTKLSPFSSELQEHPSHVEQRKPFQLAAWHVHSKQKLFWLSVLGKSSPSLKKKKKEKTLLQLSNVGRTLFLSVVSAFFINKEKYEQPKWMCCRDGWCCSVPSFCWC